MGEAKRRHLLMAGGNSEAAQAALEAAKEAVGTPQVMFELKVQIMDDGRVGIKHPPFPPKQEQAAINAMLDLLAEAMQLVIKEYANKEISPILAPPPGFRG